MWGSIVNRDGVVCAVAFTGGDRGSEWPGSRVISAQKANTANSFSLPGLALSTANLWAAVQPVRQAMLWSAHDVSPLTPIAPTSTLEALYIARPPPNTFTPPILAPTSGSVAVPNFADGPW